MLIRCTPSNTSNLNCILYLPLLCLLHYFSSWGNDKVLIHVFSDEPVTEAYNFLGFHVGWGTRRFGSCRHISLISLLHVASSIYSLWPASSVLFLLQRIAFARHATVSILMRWGHVCVQIARWSRYAICATLASVWFIRSKEDSQWAITLNLGTTFLAPTAVDRTQSW
jgi:hypothetical protein